MSYHESLVVSSPSISFKSSEIMSSSKKVNAGRHFEKIEKHEQNCLIKVINQIFNRVYQFFEFIFSSIKQAFTSKPTALILPETENRVPSQLVSDALNSSLANSLVQSTTQRQIQINDVKRNRFDKLLVEIYTTEKTYLEGVRSENADLIGVCFASCILNILLAEVGQTVGFIDIKEIREHFYNAEKTTTKFVEQLDKILKLDSLETKALAVVNLYRTKEFKEYGKWMTLCAADMKLLDILCQTLEGKLPDTIDAKVIANFKSSYALPMQRAMRHSMLLQEIRNLVEGEDSKAVIDKALEQIKRVTDRQGKLVVDTHLQISRNLLDAIQNPEMPAKLTLANNVLTITPHVRSFFRKSNTKISKQAVYRFLSDLLTFAKAPDIKKQDVQELFGILSQNDWAMEIIKNSEKCQRLYDQLKKEL